MSEQSDALDTFLRFADGLQEAHALARRPAYREACACGGSVEVGRDVPAVERRRIRETFTYRHSRCLTHPDTTTHDSAEAQESEER